jgi:cyclopropane-fatty-acyl-phospholipid synthase
VASQRDIETTYDWMDYFHELRLGKHADITAAFFDGDVSKSLEQAQKDKHAWVFDGLGVDVAHSRFLDIGCGWGPTLNAIKERGGEGVGLTLSGAQARYCQRAGLDARVLDWQEAEPSALGRFDAVISIGAFEHFCSEEAFNQGGQLQIYERFFDFCAAMLPIGRRMFLQTMTWGRAVPVSAKISLDAPEGTPERILARMRKFYPGSWPPIGKDQIVDAASKRFRYLKSSNGRKDYIETLNRWGEGTAKLWKFPAILKALPAFLRLAPRLAFDRDFRLQISSLWHNDQQQCFIDEIMSHERIFFEKIN